MRSIRAISTLIAVFALVLASVGSAAATAEAAAAPNDKHWGLQWGPQQVRAPQAWATSTGAGQKIAIVDSGIDRDHPDLAAKIVGGRTFIDCGASGCGNGDWESGGAKAGAGDPHGTHVAGTIAAEGNNNVGVVGVNWWAQIMPLKFLGPDGSGSTSNAIKALDYAVANGAKISNNSYGGVGGYSLSFSLALKKADTAGHLFVAAAGNGGADGIGDDNDTTPSYPASYDVPNVVSVAATDNKDALAGFSNYGATSVDLAAPGVAIRSTLPNSTYGTYSGTSMATPHVAGVAALIKSKGPTLDDAGIKAKLLGSADKKLNLTGKEATGGRLNAGQAVDGPPVGSSSGHSASCNGCAASSSRGNTASIFYFAC